MVHLRQIVVLVADLVSQAARLQGHRIPVPVPKGDKLQALLVARRPEPLDLSLGDRKPRKIVTGIPTALLDSDLEGGSPG